MTAGAGTAGAAAAGSEDRLELLLERRGESIALLSPGVGLFVAAREHGDTITGGSPAGVLLVLGRAVVLVAPAGVDGRVVSSPPATAVRRPVGWGDLLYEVRPLDLATAGSERRPLAATTPSRGGGSPDARLLFRSPQTGRFYLRPAPAEEPFVEPGGAVEDGQPIGLIEVMKTFAHVRYTAGGGLPVRARVVRVLVEDGADVGAGDAILEVEPCDPAPREVRQPGSPID